MRYRKTALSYLISARQRPATTRCAICQRPPDSEEIVHQTMTSTKVLVRCHGAEELRTFEHQAREAMADGELGRLMSRVAWFEPGVGDG